MGVPLPSALALLILIGCAGSPAELLFPRTIVTGRL
jgi:hypothetical protein